MTRCASPKRTGIARSGLVSRTTRSSPLQDSHEAKAAPPLRDTTSSRIIEEQRGREECRALVRAIRSGNVAAGPPWWEALPSFLKSQHVVHDGTMFKQGGNGILRIRVPRELRGSLAVA